MASFSLQLTAEEEGYLKDLVKWSLLYYFERSGNPASREVPAPPEDSVLQNELGAFVTYTIDGHLRGCIGQVIGRGPLYQAVAQMAQAAAFNDPRFPPVQLDELDKLKWEISVMGPVQPCLDWQQIEIGKHGLIIQKDNYSGLLLPQVASDRGWDKETFLEQLCHKASLEPNAWKAEDTQLFWFECVIVK